MIPKSAFVPRKRILKISEVSASCCDGTMSAFRASIRMLPVSLSACSRRGLISRKPAPAPGTLFVANKMQKGAAISGQTLVCLSSTPLMMEVTSSASDKAWPALPFHHLVGKAGVREAQMLSGHSALPTPSLATQKVGRDLRSAREATDFTTFQMGRNPGNHITDEVPIGQLSPTCPGRIPYDQMVLSEMVSPTIGPRLPSSAPSPWPSLFTLCRTLPRKFSNLNLSTGFGSGSSSIDMRYKPNAANRSADSLISKPTICLYRIDLRVLVSGRFPSARQRSAISSRNAVSKKDASARCRIKDLRATASSVSLQGTERRANHKISDRSGCVVAPFLPLPGRRVITQIEFVCLTQNSNRNVRKVEIIPFLFPAKKQLVIWRTS